MILNFEKRKEFPYAIIIFGMLLRLYHYLYNRSLFGDEAYIATNIIYRGFYELLQPLEYNQRAPIGYLYAVEFTSRLFGYNEYSLRLFSLFTGIVSLFLFYRLARIYLQPLSVNIGLAIMSFSAPLIYYSSELKQYMTELLVTIILYILYNFFKDKFHIKYMVAWGLIGGLLIWFSYPSVFIIGGFGLFQAINLILRKKYVSLSIASIAYFFWIVSVLINFVFFIKSGTENNTLQEFWEYHFMPVSFSWSTLRWFARLIYQTLDTPLGLDYSIIAVLFFFVGIVYLFLYNKELFFLLIIPIILTLIASALHKYPFHKRFLLFLTPVLIIFISEGAVYCLRKISSHQKVFAQALIIIFLLPPIASSFYYIFNPLRLNIATRQEIRPVIKYILRHKQPGDKLIVNKLAFAQFRYYSFLYKIDTENVERVAINWNDRLKETGLIPPLENKHPDFFVNTYMSASINSQVSSINAKRLWVLFARDKNNEEAKSIKYLDQIGKRLTVKKDEKASAYLYLLNK